MKKNMIDFKNENVRWTCLLTLFVIGLASLLVSLIFFFHPTSCPNYTAQAKVLTVYFTPHSFGQYEKFTGKAEIVSPPELTGQIVDYDYHLDGTVSVGDIIISHKGCEYLNQPF